jgi:hypothetical protein
MAETDAFVNVRKAEKDWADPTKIVWVKPGAMKAQGQGAHSHSVASGP